MGDLGNGELGTRGDLGVLGGPSSSLAVDDELCLRLGKLTNSPLNFNRLLLDGPPSVSGVFGVEGASSLPVDGEL